MKKADYIQQIRDEVGDSRDVVVEDLENPSKFHVVFRRWLADDFNGKLLNLLQQEMQIQGSHIFEVRVVVTVDSTGSVYAFNAADQKLLRILPSEASESFLTTLRRRLASQIDLDAWRQSQELVEAVKTLEKALKDVTAKAALMGKEYSFHFPNSDEASYAEYMKGWEE